MNFIMIPLHAANPEESISFYGKLGFKVHADDVDGAGSRYVRLTHGDLPGVLINLKNAPYLLTSNNVEPHDKAPRSAALSLVVDDYMKWLDVIDEGNMQLESEVFEPWGVWLYLRDPSGNIVCLTNRDLW